MYACVLQHEHCNTRAFSQFKEVLSQRIVRSEADFSVIPPPFVAFVGVETEPNSIFLSSTVSVVLLIVVVVPLTVRSLVTTKLSAVRTPVLTASCRQCTATAYSQRTSNSLVASNCKCVTRRDRNCRTSPRFNIIYSECGHNLRQLFFFYL